MKLYDRRSFLKDSTALVAMAALAPALRAASSFKGMDPYFSMDATEQAELVRKGEVTSLELTEAAIKRVERLNPTLNAVVEKYFEYARTLAAKPPKNGPFAGVPYLLKDEPMKGRRMNHASYAFPPEVAESNSPHAQSVLDMGFVTIGQTNTPEVGMIASTESRANGPCKNPWNLEYSVLGSSGGAGAALASGMVSIAQGSDAGGSIRMPASANGVFGIKPSRGRDRGTDDSIITTTGPLSRSVRDSATYLYHLQEANPVGMEKLPLVSGPNKRRLKVAMFSDRIYGMEPDRDVAARIHQTGELLESLGHSIEIVRPEFSGDEYIHNFDIIAGDMMKAAFNDYEQASGSYPGIDQFEPWLINMSDSAKNHKPGDVAAAHAYNMGLTATFRRFFKDYDVWLTPTMPFSPFKTGVNNPMLKNETYAELHLRQFSIMSYTMLANATGMASMSVPLHHHAKNNLPVGSMFTADIGNEATLLELAFELEAAAPWKDRWAPNSAMFL